ncbi:class I SAM-dependent methyltransferase [candidate division KSB1 bacterium]|nr:class I SAM-dependent methyltransferase [candidate division KSB1 bacterium]
MNEYPLLNCRQCGFVFADLSQEQSINANFNYSCPSMTVYEQSQTYLDDLWFESVAKKLSLRTGKGRVLDIGCGNGLLLSKFKKLGWDCYGLDVSDWSEYYAKKYDFTLFKNEIEANEIPAGFFDLAVSTSTLEHLFDPKEHLMSIINVLKPGGTLYIAGVPNFNSVSVRLGVSKFHYNKPPAHANYFTPESIYNLIKRMKKFHKLKYIKINTYGVPESFLVYDTFKNSWRKNKKSSIADKKSKIYTPIAANTKIISNYNNRLFGFVKAISSLLVNINYFLGRLFYLGDKIETIIIKDSQL